MKVGLAGFKSQGKGFFGNVCRKVHRFVEYPSHLDAFIFQTINDEVMLDGIETASCEEIITCSAARAKRVIRDFLQGGFNLIGINIELGEALV